MTMLIDSHCHLNDLDLEALGCGSLDDALKQAHDHGVDRFLCVNVDWKSWPKVRDIAEGHEAVKATVGIHPCHVMDQEDIDQDALHEHAQHPEVLALGETGLDYYRNPEREEVERQKRSLIQHIEVAKSVGKPLVIHSRSAKADTIALLRDHGASEAGAVMHCFAEDWPMAEQALELGFYISLSGIVTFKNAKNVHEVAEKVPLERLLVETDAPYLAPVPHRGQANTPAYVRYVAERIAALRDLPYEEIASVTRENTLRLFGDFV